MPAASRGMFVSYEKKKMSAPSEETTDDTAQGVRDYIVDNTVDKQGPKGSLVWRNFCFLKSDTKHSSVHCKLCRAHVLTKVRE